MLTDDVITYNNEKFYINSYMSNTRSIIKLNHTKQDKINNTILFIL